MAWYDILIRLGSAVFIGLVIGFERERHHRPAGMKTHIMVCIGAAVVSLIQVQMIQTTIDMINDNPVLADTLKADVGRLGAQVISGIGFLGAGTILVKKESIKGLTTAATLWLTACIGLAVGMGYYFISYGTFVLVMIVLILLRLFQRRRYKKNVLMLEIDLSQKKGGMDSVSEFCAAREIGIKSIEFTEEDADDQHFKAIYTLLLPRSVEEQNVLQGLLRENYIKKAILFTE